MAWYGTDYDALDYIEGLCINDTEDCDSKDIDDIECPYNHNCNNCKYPGECYEGTDKLYYNTKTGAYLTETQFRNDCIKYINSKEWEEGSKPTVSEVMLNTDYIISA